MEQPVVNYYQNALKKRGYKEDKAQKQAIDELQRLYDELQDPRHQHVKASAGGGFLSKLFNRKSNKTLDTPKGVYMWGGVGRGKSFLMDSFYDVLNTDKKIRIHFHEFMRSVHQELRNIKQMENPLDVVAAQTADKYKVICFDEFHVSNIADGMVLYRLLLKLVEHGCVFVMTSNYEPSTIYPDGLNRQRILPAIDLIQDTMSVLNVDIGVDYRHRALEQAKLYYHPLNEENYQSMETFFHEHSGEKATATEITVENRPLMTIGRTDKVVWFDFETLCMSARSQNDYISLAGEYETIMLSGVPKMDSSMASPARRFTWLIDVLYDYKVKLIMLADCPAEELYTQGTLANEFTRTVSRIVEMQSKDYLNAARRQNIKL